MIVVATIILDVLILPQAPDDAFKARQDRHVAYRGVVEEAERIQNGWMHQATLCRDINVWHTDPIPTNTSVEITGSIQNNTMYADEAQPS